MKHLEKAIKGRRYGRLTLTGNIIKKKYSSQNSSLLEARCDCGSVKTYFPCNLRRGITKSCGCLQKELARKKHSKPVFYEGKKRSRKDIIEMFKAKNGNAFTIKFKGNKVVFEPSKFHSLRENSMAGLGRKVGKSREMIRILKKRGFTDKQILKRYNKI